MNILTFSKQFLRKIILISSCFYVCYVLKATVPENMLEKLELLRYYYIIAVQSIA